MNEILKAATQATADLCAANGIKFVSPEYYNAATALKSLFMAGKIDLIKDGKHYSFDDFVGILLPESIAFIDMCYLAAEGDTVDFNKVFGSVVDEWISYTIDYMSDSDLQEALDQL